MKDSKQVLEILFKPFRFYWSLIILPYTERKSNPRVVLVCIALSIILITIPFWLLEFLISR